MSKVYVFLADGFEEIEGLTVVDLLRRAGHAVTTVSIHGRREIMGGHDIPVLADKVFEEMDFDQADMLVLPGGGVGTENLEQCEPLLELLRSFDQKGKYLAAICAAPRVLAGIGLLDGRNATCYPSVMECLTKANTTEHAVEIDGHIITSRGMGTAIDFSLALIEVLENRQKADEIAKSIVYRA